MRLSFQFLLGSQELRKPGIINHSDPLGSFKGEEFFQLWELPSQLTSFGFDKLMFSWLPFFLVSL
jgi:hypothetical protein